MTIPTSKTPDASHAPTEPIRVAAYLDGFSVYYGLKSKGWQRFYWLDLRKLVTNFLLPTQTLVGVKYFSSRVTKPPDSKVRQSTYLDAIEAHGGVELVEGRYENRPVRCDDCGNRWGKPKEKMTDVALATHLIVDAYADAFDTALLVCADADLIPAVEAVQRTGRRVLVASPPGRRSDELKDTASGALHFRRSWFNQSQLPDPVPGKVPLRRPAEWR